jgi:hypothetical protein
MKKQTRILWKGEINAAILVLARVQVETELPLGPSDGNNQSRPFVYLLLNI